VNDIVWDVGTPTIRASSFLYFLFPEGSFERCRHARCSGLRNLFLKTRTFTKLCRSNFVCYWIPVCSAYLVEYLWGSLCGMYIFPSIPVAAWFKAYACCRALAGIVGLNSTGGMDVCLLWVFVLSGRGLCDGPIPRPDESYQLWCVWVWSNENKQPRHLLWVGRRGEDYVYISSAKLETLGWRLIKFCA
jgi:hypothetical protein